MKHSFHLRQRLNQAGCVSESIKIRTAVMLPSTVFRGRRNLHMEEF